MFKNIILFAMLSCMLSFIHLQAQKNEGLFFVFLNSNPDAQQITEGEKERLQAAHLENIERLSKQGKLLAAGPFEGGGGIFILDTDRIDEARALLQTDPAIKADRFKIEVLPFRVTGNDLCGAKEPYDMATYQFVRFISNPDYSEDFDDMTAANRIFLANLNNQHDYVIAYGSFSEYNDGMIILDVADAATAENIVKKHPSVTAGQLYYEIRSLWIARGTFCKH